MRQVVCHFCVFRYFAMFQPCHICAYNLRRSVRKGFSKEWSKSVAYSQSCTRLTETHPWKRRLFWIKTVNYVRKKSFHFLYKQSIICGSSCEFRTRVGCEQRFLSRNGDQPLSSLYTTNGF